MKTAPLILLALAGLGIASAAMPETDMKPSKIAIFKNNYGFVTLQGQLGDHATTRLNSLPIPAQGTLWVQAEQGATIKQLRSIMTDETEPLPVDMMQLAAANPNCKARIVYTLNGKDLIEVEGNIVPFPKQINGPQERLIGARSEEEKNPMLGEVLMLRTETSTLSIAAKYIIGIEYMGEIKMPTRSIKRTQIELQLEQAAAGKTIEASCLSAGITWQPSYRLDLHDDGTALLSAKACIINNLMELQNVSLELVSGYPSLNAGGEIDPIANPYAKKSRNGAPEVIVSAGATPTMMASIDMGLASGLGEGLGTGTEIKLESFAKSASKDGTDTGNLFFYPIASFSAKAGEVVTQPLFSEQINYEHVYTWKLDDPSDYPHESNDRKGDIWDCVRFTNPLAMPLTAASVEFMQRGRIAGTNNIQYTPSQSRCTVKMNRAINMTTTMRTAILNQSVISYPSRYDRSEMRKVTKTTYKVTLRINNPSEKDAALEVTQPVRGHVIKVGQSGQLQSSAQQGTAYLDKHNTIRWKQQVPAKGTLELQFEYERIN